MKSPDRFLAASQDVRAGRPALVGLPLDMTSSYRSGCGDAPAAIRKASDSIETYSPLLDLDLKDSPFTDTGDLPLLDLSLDAALAAVEDAARAVLNQGYRPLFLGGEHTVALPTIQAARAFYQDLAVIQLDAHTDLRAEYDGSEINHATVIRRIAETVGPEGLIQMGIRSGTRDEFRWMRRNGTALEWGPGREKLLFDRIAERPVYVTLDLDVLDPSAFPGTGNPEAGGWTYRDLERFILALTRVDLIGCDVVEVNPAVDTSEVSSVTAAKIVRELLLVLGNRPPTTAAF